VRSALATRNTSLDPINTIRAQARQSKLIAISYDIHQSMPNQSRTNTPRMMDAHVRGKDVDASGPVAWVAFGKTGTTSLRETLTEHVMEHG
jgi:hypothetical protein